MELLIWTWVCLPVVFLGVILAMYVRERRLRDQLEISRGCGRRALTDLERTCRALDKVRADLTDLQMRVRRQDASMRTLKAWNTRYRDVIAGFERKEAK